MEKKLKLSQQLSFRGWPQDFVAQLLKLETDNEELVKENRELKNDIRARIEANRRQTGNDSQPSD